MMKKAEADVEGEGEGDAQPTSLAEPQRDERHLVVVHDEGWGCVPRQRGDQRRAANLSMNAQHTLRGLAFPARHECREGPTVDARTDSRASLSSLA